MIAGAAGVVALPLAGLVKVCPVKSPVKIPAKSYRAQSNLTIPSQIPSQISHSNLFARLQTYGTSYMGATMLLAAAFETAFGVAKLGKLAGNRHNTQMYI